MSPDGVYTISVDPAWHKTTNVSPENIKFHWINFVAPNTKSVNPKN